MPDEKFDYIVIGSGSAGGVVAARLTEDPDVRVLLLEAGPADDDDNIHIPLAFSTLFKTRWDWNYETTPQKHLDGRRAYWPRMKALGGCSSMNAMIYIRGNHADYDEWRDAYGATGWGFDDVLPYFTAGRGQHPPRRPVPRERRSAARRGPDLRPRAEHGVRRGGRRRRAQAQRRLQRRRAGGRRALPGDVQEGAALVRRGRLHPPGRHAPQPDRPHRGLRDAHRAGGQPRRRCRLHPPRRAPRGEGGRRGRPQRRRHQQPAAADAVRHRPRRPPARHGHRRRRRVVGSGPEPAGPPRGGHPQLHQGHDRHRGDAGAGQPREVEGDRQGSVELQRRGGGCVLHLARRPRAARHPAARRADRLLRQRHARARTSRTDHGRDPGQRAELGPRQAALGRPRPGTPRSIRATSTTAPTSTR